MTKAVSTETVTTGWTHQRSSRRVSTSGPPRAPPMTIFVELSTTATSAPPCELAPWPILGNLVGGPGPSEPASRTDPRGEAEAHRPLVFPLARDQEGDDVLDERGGARGRTTVSGWLPATIPGTRATPMPARTRAETLPISAPSRATRGENPARSKAPSVAERRL